MALKFETHPDVAEALRLLDFYDSVGTGGASKTASARRVGRLLSDHIANPDPETIAVGLIFLSPSVNRPHAMGHFSPKAQAIMREWQDMKRGPFSLLKTASKGLSQIMAAADIVALENLVKPTERYVYTASIMQIYNEVAAQKLFRRNDPELASLHALEDEALEKVAKALDARIGGPRP